MTNWSHPLRAAEQLRIGGRLVIPYQVTLVNQRLLCLTRVEENKFDPVTLCGVQFVPLAGTVKD